MRSLCVLFLLFVSTAWAGIMNPAGLSTSIGGTLGTPGSAASLTVGDPSRQQGTLEVNNTNGGNGTPTFQTICNGNESPCFELDDPNLQGNDVFDYNQGVFNFKGTVDLHNNGLNNVTSIRLNTLIVQQQTSVASTSASTVPMTVGLASGQTANAVEIRDSSNALLADIGADTSFTQSERSGDPGNPGSNKGICYWKSDHNFYCENGNAVVKNLTGGIPYSARILGDGGCSRLQQFPVSWLNTSHTGTGTCSLSFLVFNSVASCTCSVNGVSGLCSFTTAATSSGAVVQTLSTGLVAADDAFDIICQGD